MDLTLRQVTGLLTVIKRADLIDFYNSILSYRTSQAKEIPSLNEFLSAALDEAPKAFDDDTDQFLEAQARKRFEERKAANG